MAAVVGALGAASAVLSAVSNVKRTKADARTLESNARISEERASLERQAGAENARRQRVANTKALGRIRSAYGASGVRQDGSALAVLEESRAAGELEALQFETESERAAYGYEQSAQSDRAQARQLRKSTAFDVLTGALRVGAAGYQAYEAMRGARPNNEYRVPARPTPLRRTR